LLRPHGSSETKEAYQRVLAEWLALPVTAASASAAGPEALLVNELILAYWKFAESHYGFTGDGRRGDW
jgi:hypothetical protein